MAAGRGAGPLGGDTLWTGFGVCRWVSQTYTRPCSATFCDAVLDGKGSISTLCYTISQNSTSIAVAVIICANSSVQTKFLIPLSCSPNIDQNWLISIPNPAPHYINHTVLVCEEKYGSIFLLGERPRHQAQSWKRKEKTLCSPPLYFALYLRCILEVFPALIVKLTYFPLVTKSSGGFDPQKRPRLLLEEFCPSKNSMYSQLQSGHSLK